MEKGLEGKWCEWRLKVSGFVQPRTEQTEQSPYGSFSSSQGAEPKHRASARAGPTFTTAVRVSISVLYSLQNGTKAEDAYCLSASW